VSAKSDAEDPLALRILLVCRAADRRRQPAVRRVRRLRRVRWASWARWDEAREAGETGRQANRRRWQVGDLSVKKLFSSRWCGPEGWRGRSAEGEGVRSRLGAAHFTGFPNCRPALPYLHRLRTIYDISSRIECETFPDTPGSPGHSLPLHNYYP
jgi:hypothetical protein